MKSFEELNAIRDRVKGRIDLRSEKEDNIRVIVGMATCGIASGARPVLNALAQLVAEKQLNNVTVVHTGCIGLCRYEPIVEVLEPGKEKVTYVHMTADKAAEIVESHLIKGKPLVKYTLSAAEKES